MRETVPARPTAVKAAGVAVHTIASHVARQPRRRAASGSAMLRFASAAAPRQGHILRTTARSGRKALSSKPVDA